MPDRQDMDNVLKDWPFEPGEVSARLIRASDGREVIQMRVELGVLQMEVERRPDGVRPEGAETYFDFLLALAVHEGDEFTLSEAQCEEADREFVQYYHRRVCWLTLREFKRAVRDADHTLAFMDFLLTRSPNEDWTASHEKYRPFIIFHRTQAAALAVIEEGTPERSLEEINAGLERIRKFFEEHEALEQFDEDELVVRLHQLKESLREHYQLGKTLSERLADAIAAEQYEIAAELRDQMSKRGR